MAFLRRNFQALGEKEAEQKTVLLGAVFVIALIGLLPFLPENFPNMAIPIATIVATRLVVEKYQFTKQAIAESDSLDFQSNWRVLWVALLSLVVFVIAAMAFMLGLESFGLIKLT